MMVINSALQTELFIKKEKRIYVNYWECVYDNINHISVKQYEEENYIRRQLELLGDLYTREVLDEDHFRD